MSRSLFTGVSGLRAHQLWLDVIGDNVANANTVGFKPSTVLFTDVLGQTLSSGATPTSTRGGTNPLQLGAGVALGSITPTFVQGSLQSTGRNTDLAIEGNGFFVLENGNERLYTRAGAFMLDANGYLVDSASGYLVQGAGGDIQITQGLASSATATTEAFFQGNLDSTAADGTTHVLTFDVRDSLGAAHTLTVTFTKNFAGAPGQWDWEVTEGDAVISSLSGATGSLVFAADGTISSGATASLQITYPASAGVTTPQTVALDFGSAASPAALTGLASPSTVTLQRQDGQAPGALTGFTIGRDGDVIAYFSNGATTVIDTVQLASFNNPSGLLKAGRNHWRESATSGLPSTGDPGTADRGSLMAGALEQSAVDLAAEFTAMIVAQRGFQANARTITTASEVLEELVNLHR